MKKAEKDNLEREKREYNNATNLYSCWSLVVRLSAVGQFLAGRWENGMRLKVAPQRHTFHLNRTWGENLFSSVWNEALDW